MPANENRAPLPLREIQLVELDILKTIHRICEKHGIRYSLAAGSILGAVRHKGFIPWDDDVDLLLPRADYQRLCQILPQELPAHMEFRNGETDVSLPYRFGKVVNKRVEFISRITRPQYALGHVFVDLFPLDGCPSDPKALETLRKKHRLYSMLHNAVYTAPAIYQGPKKLFAQTAGALLSPAWVSRRLLSLHQKYSQPGSALLCCGGYTWDAMWVHKASYFQDLALIPFEDGQFWAVSDPDAYLTAEFGDYMTPPPEDKRASTHQADAYYLEGYTLESAIAP